MGKSDILFLIILRIFLYIYRNGQCECEIYFVSHTQEIVTVDSPIHSAHDGCLTGNSDDDEVCTFGGDKSSRVGNRCVHCYVQTELIHHFMFFLLVSYGILILIINCI